jgi:50S ribosomal protein L16 3-hydroxylase
VTDSTDRATDAPALGMPVRRFLREHWHKEARLVRNAIPDAGVAFDRRTLTALALRDNVESRLVVREGSRWTVAHGPFRRADFRALPERNWTLLVQGLNLHSHAADALLRRFAFLPYARLDDVMVSYAVPGGGVGPHVDSYDVFLLQGFGRRRWRYGRQQDTTLRAGLPLRILARFAPEHAAVLEYGDMLYLPPRFAHDGVALDECTTYSIGFRAPSAQELATAFLDFLRDRIAVDGRYADPELAATREPARIDAAMRRKADTLLKAIRWTPETVAEFLGVELSTPKATVVFDPPRRPLSRAAFAKRIARHGVALDLRTQLLYDERRLYINGIACTLDDADAGRVTELANRRALPAAACASLGAAALDLLHDWHRHGYLEPV